MKLSVLWRDGVQQVNTKTRGVGISGGGIGMGTAKTRGTAQTMSSVGAAPPGKPGGGGYTVVWLVSGGVGIFAMNVVPVSPEWVPGAAFLAALLGMACVLLPTAKRTAQRYESDYQTALSQWKRTYRCNRCERRFLVAEG